MLEPDILPEHLQRPLVDFVLYWNFGLRPRLENCLTLARSQPLTQSKNEMLVLLFNEYRNHTIGLSLLRVYEVVQALKSCDAAYDPPPEVKLLIKYRNKLLVHYEESKHNEKT